MNKPIFYLPFSLLVVLSIVHLSISIPSFSLILNFTRFLWLSAFLALATAVFIYFKFKNKYDFDNLYKLTGSTVLFSFILWLALITFCSARYTTKNCNSSSYELISYTGRYTSGFGKVGKEKLKANQWIMAIIKEGKQERFVLNKDISDGETVTKRMELQFCKGLLGTEYLNLEQITR